MDRDQLKTSLNESDLGSFIIRFSEKFPGKFAISYISLRGDGLKHYLITLEDMNSKRTLGDFIIQSKTFLRVLKLEGFSNEGMPLFKSLPKTETFKPFVSEQLSLELEDVDYTPLDVIYDYSSLQEDNKSKKKEE